jgi:hypothetical protein
MVAAFILGIFSSGFSLELIFFPQRPNQVKVESYQ